MKPVDPRLLRAAPALRGYLARLALGTAVSAALVLAQAVLLVDVIVRGTGGAGPGELAAPLAGFAAAACGRALLSWLAGRDGERTAPRVTAELRARLLRAVTDSVANPAAQPVAHPAAGPAAGAGSDPGRAGAAARPATGRLAVVAGAGLDGMDTYLTRFLPALVTVAVVPPVVLAALARADLWSAAVLGLTLPLVPLFMVLVGLATRARTRRQWAVLSRLSHHFLDVVEGLSTLKVFGRAQAQVATIRRVSEAYRAETMSALRLAFASAVVMELLATLSVALVAVEIGLRLVAGSVGFDTALLVLVLAPEVHLPLRQVGSQFHATMSGLTAASAALDILDEARAARQAGEATRRSSASHAARGREAGGSGAGAGGAPPGGRPVTVELAGVEVRRPDRPEPTLRGVDLRLEAGEITALVGPSGAGKSTLVDLLRGALRPTAGRVLVDGVDLADIDPPSWRSRVGWLPQRPHALGDGGLAPGPGGTASGTVAAEVALGLPRARRVPDGGAGGTAGGPGIELSAELPGEVVAAMAAAGTPPGHRRVGEDGRALSAGELRRVALARALVRGAPLVLLDEPGESVDPATEAHLAAAVAALRGRATVVVVAHSDALTRIADRVVTLVDGRVVQDSRVRDGRAVPDGGTTPGDRRCRDEGLVRDTQTGADRDPTGARTAVPPLFTPAPAASTPATSTPAASTPAASTPVTAAAGASAPVTPAAAAPEQGGRGRGDRPLRRAARLLAPARPRLALGILAGTGAILCGIGLTASAAWLISRASAHPPVLHLMVAVVAVRAFGLGRPALRYAERLLTHDAALRGLARLRSEVFARLVPLAPAGLAEHRRGDLLRRFTADVDGLAEAVARAVAPLATTALAALGATALVAVLLPPAGLVLAAGLALAAAAAFAAARRGRAAQTAAERERARRDAAVVALAERLDEAVAFDVADDRLARLRRSDDELVRAASSPRRSTAWGPAAQTLLAGVCTAAAAAVGTGAVQAGALSWELLAVVVLTTLAAFEPAAALTDAFLAGGRAGDAARRVFTVLDAEPAVPSAPAAPPEAAPGSRQGRPAGGAHPADSPHPADGAPAALPAGPLDVHVEQVRAGYRSGGRRGPAVLDGVDLYLPAGSRVALVGPSGAGKSTLANLLLRFADPWSGRILVGGVDLRELPEEALRRAVVGLTQDAHVFDATVRENLLLARPDATDEQLTEVLGRVGLGDWLRSLPRGLGSRVGPDGARLSGGQRQRLVLARVLLTDARVIVADEPTAHLDAATERTVMDLLLTLAADRTVLVITHRRAALEHMDAVYELSADGRVRPTTAAAVRAADPGGDGLDRLPEPPPAARLLPALTAPVGRPVLVSGHSARLRCPDRQPCSPVRPCPRAGQPASREPLR